MSGIIGTYLFKVTDRETGSYYTEDDAKANQARMGSYHLQMLQALMAEDNVTDNRARFY